MSSPANVTTEKQAQTHNEFAAAIEQEFQNAQLQSWEYASLFDQLATSMYHAKYDWSLLLHISPILLGEKDRRSASPQPEGAQAAAPSSRRKKTAAALDLLAMHGRGEEEEEDEEEEDTVDNSIDSTGDSGAAATTGPSSDQIVASELGTHQTRAFRYLQVAIIRYLSPTASTSKDGQHPLSTSTGSAPVLLPKSGDVIGVWLVSLLCAARNKSIALSFIRTIEILARVAALKITIQRCFQLLQRERPEEEAAGADDVTSTTAEFDPSRIVSPHVPAGYLTPSSFLPLPVFSNQVLQRFNLHVPFLRMLQVIIGDGVHLPTIATLSGESDSLTTKSQPSSPNVWYEFIDTPIFPRISGGAAPSANGYCWSCWLNVASLPPSPSSGRTSPSMNATASPTAGTVSSHQNNVFRFFNDIGHGVQVYIKNNTLCVRVLPNAVETFPLKNFLLHENRWVFLTIVHKPRAKPVTTTPLITSNMANITSFQGKHLNQIGVPNASFRPSVAGMPPPSLANANMNSGSSLSPTSPGAPPRPAHMFLYVDGVLVSSNDVPYPAIDHSETMQVSLGGFHGKMGPFHFFHDLLSPSSIYSLYTLGAGLYSAPAHHVVNTGLVCVFPPPPSSTSLNVVEHATASGSTNSKDDPMPPAPTTGPPPIVSHRIVSRVLLSHSPSQTTHEYCLPMAWADDWNVDWHLKAPHIETSSCTAHTLRLPGVGVQQRCNNSQWFVDVGGLKLLLQSLSHMYAGPSSSMQLTDEIVAEQLALVAYCCQANPHNANQLFEIGAATFKQLLLEHLRKKHKTAVLINGLKRFLLVVAAIDHTNEQAHFASFVSYLLLDLTYWRMCSPHIQSLVIHLLKLLVLHNPRPFVLHPSIGVSRVADSIRVITHRFFAPETQSLPTSSSTLTSAVNSPNSPEPFSESQSTSALTLNVDAPFTAPMLSAVSPTSTSSVLSPPPSSVSTSSEPTDSELNLVRTLMSIAFEIAQQSMSSPTFEQHVLQPFLHLLQLSTVSASNFPPQLLVEFLTALLHIIPISSHRALTFIHQHGAAHIFVKLLFGDSVTVRTLSLHCIQYLNYHLVRLNKLDRNRGGAAESMFLQSDIATAIGSCLSLHTPISAEESDALFDLLMGQVPPSADSPSPNKEASSSSSTTTVAPTAHKAHRGLSLEAGLTFCHSAYLSVILELAIQSSLDIQSKLLMDLLTLLRSNPHNVLVMASLFWQKLLLPFLSKLRPASKSDSVNLIEANIAEIPSAADGKKQKVPPSQSETIDVLVYQLLNLLLVHCMTNEPKGWQVLDQVLWCLDERERGKMLTVTQQGMNDTLQQFPSTIVTDQWIVQVAIFNRLFQSLHKSVLYLTLPPKTHSGTVSSSGTADGPTTSNSAFSIHSDLQVQNLRRNLPAVFELTEWLLFHSKDSFLAPVSNSTLSRRTSSNADKPEESEFGAGGRKESMAVEPSAPAADELQGPSSLLDSTVTNVNPDMPPPMNPNYSRGSVAGLSATPSAASSSALPTSRASLRGTDEPLTESEIEVLAGLLTGVVKNYPLPERRQDVLRVMFRYLMAVLPHPLCASLCPLICECVLHLFTERITELNDKNNRLIALSLHLLKQAMETFLRREDAVSVEQCKVVMGSIFARCGPQVFHPADPTQPTRASIIYPTRGSVSGGLLPSTRTKLVSSSRSSTQSISEEPEDATTELDLMTGPSSATGNTSATSSDESPLEQALFHLYNGEGQAIVVSTQQVFEQHELRLGYVCEARARQVSDSIQGYLKKQQTLEKKREQAFSLQSMDVHRRVARERPFILGCYQTKKNKVAFRKLPRDVKHSMKIHKMIKHFHYQHANSRPKALLPIMLPTLLLNQLQQSNDPFSPYVSPSDFNPSKLNYSAQAEFWKLDSTESPTRMRRILKKNFRGSSHKAASQNAATGKTALYAPQALDLANSLKNAVVKSNTDSASTGVDAELVIPEVATPSASTPSNAATVSSLSSLEYNDEEDDGGESDDDEEAGADDDEEDEKAGAKKKNSKYLLSQDCVMITAERKYSGSIKIAQQHFVFSGIEIIKVEAPTSAGSGPEVKPPKARKPKEKFLRWPLKHIRMVLPRLYLLRESALEIFLNTFKNHFFNFTPLDEETSGLSWNSDMSKITTPSSTASASKAAANKKLRSGKEQRNEVYKLLCSLCPEMQFELSPGRRLVKSGIMKKWQRGEISNFDYLQHLNTIAGRSYNDLNQYPCFPWVLTDYKSETIDLNDESIYRDLSKPIGALNEDRFEIYSERYHTFDDPEIPGFMYGSHYSSAGIALYYLIRMEPFTKLAISLQGNHFDLADRLFDSISGAWDLSLNNVGDVKELIPEFFYLPDFLRNVNGLDLGTKQDKQKLGDVVLPPWAKGSPEEFVRIHRAALESEYVSAHLHEWIDLIFGFKQKGKAAVEANNVFFYLTYAGAIDIDAIENPALRKSSEDQVAYFGQTPAQLLTSPHPARFSAVDRAKIAAGIITLPAKLNPTYSSQLIYYYQPMKDRYKEAQLAQRRHAQAKAKLNANRTTPPSFPANDPPPLPPGAPGTFSLSEPIHGQTFDSDRNSILTQVPSHVCFAAHNVVITIASDLTFQAHNLTPFLAQPAQLLEPTVDPAEKAAAALEPERIVRKIDSATDVTEATPSSSGTHRRDSSDSKESVDGPSLSRVASIGPDPLAEPDIYAPQAAPSARAALTSAGELLVNTLASTPQLLRKQLTNMVPAWRIPSAVQSSHLVHPGCKHWFLDPAVQPNPTEKVCLNTKPANSTLHLPGAGINKPAASSSRGPSPSTSLQSSPNLAPRSSASHNVHSADSAKIFPVVTAVALNAQFLFSGGYFDGSLKCHSILHYKVEPDPAAAASSASSAADSKHTRSPTSPPVLVSGGQGSSNSTGVNRPIIQTKRTVDTKPLSTVQAHHAPITAICLAQNQSILFTGDAHGMLCAWRVFTERHERNRPPLSSAPLATFTVHEGKVISVASNTYVGIAVSLAMDMQSQRGCELAVYNVRGGSAKFIRSQLAVDPEVDWQQVVLTSSANIVIAGSQAGVPMLFLYSLNGQLLKSVACDEVLNVLYATPATAKTTAYEGFIVTGGRKSVVIFRSPHTLEPVQSFFCDELYPQSIAHVPIPISTQNPQGSAPNTVDAASSSTSSPVPVKDLLTFDNPEPVTSPVPFTPLSPNEAAEAAHTDPMLAAIVKDVGLNIRMGVAAFDIAPSQQHFVVAMYPDAFPPPPQDFDSSSPLQETKHIEGRLLLFPLPHSSNDASQLGFYLDVGWNTIETVRDALNNRISDTRDLAKEKLNEAREKLNVAKTKIFSAFSGLFGSKK